MLIKSKRVHIPPGYPNSKRQTPKLREATVILRVHHFLETVPKHVCVNLAVNLSIHVDHIDIALGKVADDCAIEDARVRVLRNVDSQRAVDLKFQSGKAVVSKSSSSTHCDDCTYRTSSPSLSLPLLPPSTPSLSKVFSCALSAANSPSNLSPSTSTSYALFATLNFSASSARISLACLPASCLFSSYSCWECRLLRRRERDLSAFCCAARRELRFEPSAERDEEMRARLSLSGAMWNWFVVSEMS